MECAVQLHGARIPKLRCASLCFPIAMQCRFMLASVLQDELFSSPGQGIYSVLAGRKQLDKVQISQSHPSPVLRSIMATCFEIVTRQVVLLGDRSFMPTQKQVQDRMFCSIQKWSPPLVKMITGKRLDLRQGKSGNSGSLNIKLFEDLLEARQKACDHLLEEALRDEECESANEPKKKKAKKEKVKALAKHVHLLPNIIDVEIDGFQLSILTEGLSTSNVWMEMLAENFTWMKEIAEKQIPAERSSRKKKHVKEEPEEDGSSAETEKKPKRTAKAKAKAQPVVPPKRVNRGPAASVGKVKK